MLSSDSLELLIPGFREAADLRQLGELGHLGESLDDLAHRAFALARDNPGWLAPSQAAAAQRLTESARSLHECSHLILRHRDHALRADDG